MTSYTLAKVENPVAFAVSPSDSALIAMPEEIDLKVRKDIIKTITLTDEDETGITNIKEKVKTTVESNNFYISNNMNEVIDVNMYVASNSKKIKNLGVVIFPGDTKEVPFLIDDSIEEQSAELIIVAAWNGGSAEIIKEVNVEVEAFVVENVKDLRKPKNLDSTENQGEEKDKDKAEEEGKIENQDEGEAAEKADDRKPEKQEDSTIKDNKK